MKLIILPDSIESHREKICELNGHFYMQDHFSSGIDSVGIKRLMFNKKCTDIWKIMIYKVSVSA